MKGIKLKSGLPFMPEKTPASFVFIFCFLILVILWIVELVLKDLSFSLMGLAEIHRSNPSLWLADLLPFLIGLFYRKFSLRNAQEKAKLREIIDSKQFGIEKYTKYANSIGKGDYSFKIITEGPEDQLGQSLQFLQNFLRANQKKENDQNWISEGKDMISRVLRLHNKMDVMSFQVLKNLITYIQAIQGAIYIYDDERKVLVNTATYAYNRQKYLRQEFRIGEGLVGECAYELDFVYRTEIPDDFMTISSGILGDKKPKCLLLVPLISEEKLQGVIEFATLNEKFPKIVIQFLLELGETIARTIYNLKINQKTEDLLAESRNMTQELRKNEQTLQDNAEEMIATQEQLRASNEQLEAKISEVQNAQGKLHWLLENASEVISIYSADVHMSYVSPSVSRILGYTPEEMIQGKDFERLTREGAVNLRRLISQTIENPLFAETIQYSFVKKEGERIYLESTAKNLLDHPAIQGIIINSRDITERIRAEKEERLKTRMQSLSENSLDMIIRLSISGNFHYANPVVEDYIAIEPAKLLNKPLSELSFSTTLHDYFENSLEKIKSNPVKTNQEISLSVKMGEKLTERIMSIDAIPEFTSNELETILFVGHDITEAKRIEKEIQIKNKNIGDSINYAERIQSALLPDIENIRESLPRSFIFYKPRDIVSGDFPFFFRKNGDIYIAAVDCTGHGVPGALLSFIGFFLLNNITDRNQDQTAAEICNALHLSVRHTLKQDTENPDSRDGMDIAFCKINLQKKELQFAGAHRPLLFLSEGELTEYKGDKKSIGGISMGRKIEDDFVNNVIPFKKSDKIFFFSDGITDQLGGPYGRKYTVNRIRDRILEHPGFTMLQYQALFEDDFAKWQEGFKQLDDVLMIGIEF
jgi:PAS domain S-box-containing protein